MTSGIFYWIAWMLWIVFFFLFVKQKHRFWYSIGVLLLIISTNWYITVGDIYLFIPLCFVLFYGMFLAAFNRVKTSTLIVAISISFGYCGMKIWNDLNAVWLFVSSTVLSVLLGYICLAIFVKNPVEKAAIWFISISFGEMLYGMIQYAYGFPTYIGNYTYLLDVVLFVKLMIVIHVVQTFRSRINRLFTHSKRGRMGV
ncbi:YphA family membrane protein [Salirhabdus salicampi]|uniref:YphA family membrane protein n=1 Tax=Salirhabdus salicampi TaxID=476102 RepID=UPI0020C2C7FB|nr:hypothetical protein [Salirhabdus salicampi]MCP8616713.1 hypothetical protein [Salirhabdus salicampi]